MTMLRLSPGAGNRSERTDQKEPADDRASKAPTPDHRPALRCQERLARSGEHRLGANTVRALAHIDGEGEGGGTEPTALKDWRLPATGVRRRAKLSLKRRA